MVRQLSYEVSPCSVTVLFLGSSFVQEAVELSVDLVQKADIQNTGTRISINIDTNEIPSELSCENMIQCLFTCEDNMLFPHVKRSLLLWSHVKIMPFDAFREMI